MPGAHQAFPAGQERENKMEESSEIEKKKEFTKEIIIVCVCTSKEGKKILYFPSAIFVSNLKVNLYHLVIAVNIDTLQKNSWASPCVFSYGYNVFCHAEDDERAEREM